MPAWVSVSSRKWLCGCAHTLVVYVCLCASVCVCVHVCANVTVHTYHFNVNQFLEECLSQGLRQVLPQPLQLLAADTVREVGNVMGDCSKALSTL